MAAEDPLLDRELIAEALRRLDDRLARRGLVADVYVFGGAAMRYSNHTAWSEAQVVADELGLPRWWLNEQASAYVAPGGDLSAPRVFDHPGLRVSAASPEHLLAMKVLAARRRDAEDKVPCQAPTAQQRRGSTGAVRRDIPGRGGAATGETGPGGYPWRSLIS